ARGDAVLFLRDAGETARGGLVPVKLEAGAVAVWDGRFAIETDEPAEIRALKGHAARLSPEARARLSQVEAAARPALAVFVSNGNVSPVLAYGRKGVSCLIEGRLEAACGVIAHERDIAGRSRGARDGASLC